VLEAEKIPFVNLYDPFLKNDPETLFVGHGDIHWNEEGQKKAAEWVTAFLKDKLAF
jgi:hypothetical protein